MLPSCLGFSRRYMAYCYAYGEHDACAMVARDNLAERSGAVRRPARWYSRQWEVWRASTGYRGPIGVAQEEAFDRWLAQRYRAPAVVAAVE